MTQNVRFALRSSTYNLLLHWNTFASFTKPVTKPVSHLMVCRSSVTRHHKRGSGLARPLRSDVFFDQAHTIFFCIGIHLHPFTKPVTKPVSHLMVCRSSVTRHHKRGSGLARPLRSDVTSGLARPFDQTSQGHSISVTHTWTSWEAEGLQAWVHRHLVGALEARLGV